MTGTLGTGGNRCHGNSPEGEGRTPEEDMQRASDRTRAAETPRSIVADEARILRARLRASRRPVDKQVDEIAGQRRGLKTADGLALFAAEMLAGGFSEQEATATLARMSERIVAAAAAQRRA